MKPLTPNAPGLSPPTLRAKPTERTVVFDHDHGQANWAQTSFWSREMDCGFLGIAENLRRPTVTCIASGSRPLVDLLPQASLVVIPPPTGVYSAARERWRARASSLFTARLIEDIVAYVHAGGRLLAFSYRFGDWFTQTNLRDLFSPLGCWLNHDAVLDLTRLRTTHPLQAYFDTPADLLPLEWSQPGVRSVRWRAMATFTLVPGANVQPLALSPGGRCISFDRTQRRISFASLPIAVAGLHGRGRFALFGGPHAFEVGTFGLLGSGDNANFLRNVLEWLQGDDPLNQTSGGPPRPRPPEWPPPLLARTTRDLTQVECQGRGEGTVLYVERLLRRTGMLKALSRARWMP